MSQFVKIIPPFTKNYFRCFSNGVIQKELKNECWDIFSAVSLERRPIITRDLNELETEFSKLLQKIEHENSHKSDFEIRIENDAMRAKKAKEGDLAVTEMDNFPQQTGHDFLDASVEDLKSFKFANRISESSDTKSLKRALDRYLLLILCEKIGEKQYWILPQGKHNPGETLRQTAERVLIEKCGSNINTRFFGNAPFGFYKYKYPKSLSKQNVGAKIFFFKAEFVSGEIKTEKEQCLDYMWATRKELVKLPNEYLKSVNMFLIDEEH